MPERTPTTEALERPVDWDHVLDAAIRDEGGEWTTRRVQALYTQHYGRGPFRVDARGCLSQRARQGLLRLVDLDPNRRHFTLTTRKDVRP